MPGKWDRKLPAVVETTGGAKIITLRQAAAFVSKQNDHRREWQQAAGALMEAAETGQPEHLSTAYNAFRNALFIDGMRLKP